MLTDTKGKDIWTVFRYTQPRKSQLSPPLTKDGVVCTTWLDKVTQAVPVSRPSPSCARHRHRRPRNPMGDIHPQRNQQSNRHAVFGEGW